MLGTPSFDKSYLVSSEFQHSTVVSLSSGVLVSSLRNLGVVYLGLRPRMCQIPLSRIYAHGM